jgi:gamma-glutamylcyclotransferase (GGCT)/AIG2-like uncharacterized protein YtfP
MQRLRLRRRESPANADMGKAIFCYGTLEFSEILEAVTGRRFARTGAVLEGYARYRIKGAVYPGVIGESGARTPGTLYTDVDRDALRRLDRYEDGIYVRCRVPVRTSDGGTVDAEVYVIPEHRRWALSARPWAREEFGRRHLARYLARLKGP